MTGDEDEADASVERFDRKVVSISWCILDEADVLLYFKEPEIGRIGGPSLNGHPELAELSRAGHENTS